MSEMLACRCSKCGHDHHLPCANRITASDTELKARLLDGSLFVWTCPECGEKNLASWPLLYMDNELHFIVLLSAGNLSSEGEIPGFVARRAATAGEMIEKIKIFEAGLDDIVLELCKYVTLQEMHKEVPLKFLRLEGSDNELIFAYPENGQMQMIEVGFNVYEDCRGILSRNPVISEKAKGLVHIDQAWIASFIA